LRVVAVPLMAALLSACAARPPATSGDFADPIRAAYVVLGGDGAALARVITTASGCPAIDVDGAPLAMTVRAAPATEALRPTLSARALSKPSAFPVLTCERGLPPGAQRASVGGHVLPLPTTAPRRIVVIGDSGCRLKASDFAYQACNDSAQWPFAQVAAAAAAARPDLVIHVGDYHYRETACPDNDAGCAGSPWGYGWDAWDADLFTPARALLAAAPWVVVRGNHESCNRAGQGWWRFLDPRPLVPGRDCNDPANDATGDFSDPYAVRIAADAQLLVFDSSKVDVAPLAATDPLYKIYFAQMQQAFALARRTPHNIFLNHHPVLAFAPNPSVTPTGVYPGNGALQSVLAAINGVRLFAESVQATLTGHVHLFQVVSYDTPQPTQLVSGNGGAWADVPLPRELPPGATPAPGARIGTIVSTNLPGFMTVERDPEVGWRIEARDRQGQLLTTCALRDAKTRCKPEILR
jgi:hypothetical protein